MTKQQFKALIALNAALLALLAAVVLSPAASAQKTRARGEYTMVSGEFQGASENAIWILDAANQELLALRWNQSMKKLDGIGFRDLSQDADRAGKTGR